MHASFEGDRLLVAQTNLDRFFIKKKGEPIKLSSSRMFRIRKTT